MRTRAGPATRNQPMPRNLPVGSRIPDREAAAAAGQVEAVEQAAVEQVEAEQVEQVEVEQAGAAMDPAEARGRKIRRVLDQVPARAARASTLRPGGGFQPGCLLAPSANSSSRGRRQDSSSSSLLT
jgi:hypothetical protein